jgi:D-3-phosphoglycerate dehydrogenase
MRAKVLITEPIHRAGVDILREVANIKQLSMSHHALDRTQSDYISEAKDALAIITRGVKTPRRVIEKLDKTRAIIVHGAGFDHIDVQAATRKGIIVCNTPESLSESVAEHVVALTLALSRGIVRGDREVRARNWVESNRKLALLSHELYRKTIGIIGLGRIGLKVATKAMGLGMRVLGYDPFLDENTIRTRYAESVDLETILRESDVVSINCPLTQETKGMLGKEQFKMMKKTAIIVNTARGAVLKETELIDALEDGQIAGAALDVLVKEPPKKKSRLLALENTVLTPHIAGLTEESMIRLSIECAEQATKVINGETPSNVINPEALENLNEG